MASEDKKRSRNPGIVARKYRWLYIYSLTVMVACVIGNVLTFHKSNLVNSPNLSLPTKHLSTTIGDGIVFIFYAALMIYVVTSNNVNRIRFILKFLLLLDLLNLLGAILKPNPYGVIIEAVMASFSLALLKQLSKDKET